MRVPSEIIEEFYNNVMWSVYGEEYLRYTDGEA